MAIHKYGKVAMAIYIGEGDAFHGGKGQTILKMVQSVEFQRSTH